MEASIKLLNRAGSDRLLSIANVSSDLRLKSQVDSGFHEYKIKKKAKPNFLINEDYKLSKRDIDDKIHDKLMYAFKVVSKLENVIDQIHQKQRQQKKQINLTEIFNRKVTHAASQFVQMSRENLMANDFEKDVLLNTNSSLLESTLSSMKTSSMTEDSMT